MTASSFVPTIDLDQCRCAALELATRLATAVFRHDSGRPDGTESVQVDNFIYDFLDYLIRHDRTNPASTVELRQAALRAAVEVTVAALENGAGAADSITADSITVDNTLADSIEADTVLGKARAFEAWLTRPADEDNLTAAAVRART